MNAPGHGPSAAVTAFLQASQAPFRTVAPGEWGVVFEDVGGRALEAGLRLAGEVDVHGEIPERAGVRGGAGSVVGAVTEAADAARPELPAKP